MSNSGSQPLLHQSPPEPISALQQYYDRRPLYSRVSQWLGLQAKLTFAFIFLVAATLGTYGLLNFQETQRNLIEGLRLEASQTAAVMAITSVNAVESQDRQQLGAIAQQVVRSNNSLLYIAFEGSDGQAFYTESRGVAFQPTGFDPSRVVDLGSPKQVNGSRFGEHFVCTQAVWSPAKQAIIGYVQVGVSMAQVREQLAVSQRAALSVGRAILLLAIPTAWMIVRRIFLPIRLLVTAAKRIAAGELQTRVETMRSDVIGELSRAFNDMVRTITGQQAALQLANSQLAEANHDLEGKVEQRTCQLETANQRLSLEIAEKEDFLRAVSHDLNAPLRNISGMVTMLLMKKRKQLDEDMLHRLERIKKNVEVETDLINELLELSRIKTRRQSMDHFELEAMIWDFRGMFENDLKTRDISLIVDTTLPTLFAEKSRVRQLFQNLIDNAIKYMGTGSRREIHVGCILHESEAEFYVRDTGQGIDPEDVGKVFYV
ncbi:MAG: sensor histidine kinase, partial [Tepidisphaeraceae bacterium]